MNDQTLAIDVIKRVGVGGHYLADKHTKEWFRKELFVPSELVDPTLQLKEWKALGSKDAFVRSREIAQKILKDHKPEPLSSDTERKLDDVARRIMKRHGIDKLPIGPF